MKHRTSKWFKSLKQEDRKSLICLLFGIRGSLEGHSKYHLFLEFLRVFDAEYHHLKPGVPGGT